MGDEPRECTQDAPSGTVTCAWVWQPCCTDGVLMGAIARDGCVRITLTAPVGVDELVVMDGADRRIARAFGVPMELCAQIRPAVP